MDETMISVSCPFCGKDLQIPAELEEYSCLYCGQRCRREPKPAVSAPDPGLFDSVCKRLPDCVLQYRGYQKRITRNDFFDAFEAYETGCASVIHDLAALGDPEQLKKAAASMLDALKATWKNNLQRDDDKIVLAIFFVPLLQKLENTAGREFAEILQKEWVSRYPRSPFFIGTYEEIAGGFRKRRFGLCFITTAVCQELGKPDDCEELTAFRRFRDDYLRHRPEGEALIEEYYNIAPGIVTCINICSDRHESYQEILHQYLLPCYDDILSGRNEACERRYTQMVRALEHRYLQ